MDQRIFEELKAGLEPNSDNGAGSVAELTLATTKASQFSPDAGMLFPARTYGKPGTLPKRSGKHRSQQSVFEIILEPPHIQIFRWSMTSF
jgi:hypothetical protein